MKNSFTFEEDFVEWVISHRRYFHQHPEMSFNEFNTQQKIVDVLNSLGIENQKIAKTGVLGMIRGRENGKTIALRSDMDALQIQEEKTSLNKAYISENDGIMHACGHDGHMAMVLGAARILQENNHHLKGNVKLIFQPAEEIPPGGAIDIIKEGGLKDVDAIIGTHLFTNIKSGEIRLREGVLMAAHCMYKITINGKSGHHYNADVNIDPILIASEFVSTIQSALKNNLPPTTQYVFGTGSINGGHQFNQTPDNVVITGSYRMLNNDILLVEKIMRKCLDGLMKMHCKDDLTMPYYSLNITYGYPQLKNHKKFTHRATQTLKEIYPDTVKIADAIFGAEDFARYLEKVPGTFIFLGAGNEENGFIHGNHSSSFDIDENVLVKGVEMLYNLTVDFLNTPDEYIN